jgi:hypothetical protein
MRGGAFVNVSLELHPIAFRPNERTQEMKKHLILFAVGAGVVYASIKANEYLNTAGVDGKKPLGDDVAKYAPYVGGGAALAVAAHFVSL